MKKTNILLILLIFTSCVDSTRNFACDWENHIEQINKQEGNVCIWHTVNKFVPEKESDSNAHNYKKDFFMQDFRQLEFVSKDYENQILTQIENAKPFKKITDYGYEKIYLRDQIPSPIKNKITLNELMKILNITDKHNLVFRGCKGEKVKNGFLIDSEYARLTGITNNSGKIEILGLNNFIYESDEFLTNLNSLMEKLNWVFVSYTEEIVLQPNQIHEYNGKY